MFFSTAYIGGIIILHETNGKDAPMGRFLKRPFAYAVIFGLALTLLLAWSLLAVFVIPRELEPEEFETVDLSAFTKPAESGSVTEPVYILTLPPEYAPDEPADTDDESKGTQTDTLPETEPDTEPIQYPIITENSYLDENISIVITTARRFGSNFHVAEVKLSDPKYLKTALAEDTYGLNIKEKTSVQARRVGAILAINGDYYGANEKGYVIRNGILYRRTVRPTNDKRRKYFEDLAILWDGSFTTFYEQEVSASEILGQGAMQVFGFGPTLIKNGEITVDADTEVGIANPSGNPRTAICYVGEGHYLFVVADGRTDQSKGPTLLELATVLQELGAVTAYNLDGGGSATMYFNGRLISNPCTNWNEIHEREVSDIVYIGY